MGGELGMHMPGLLTEADRTDIIQAEEDLVAEVQNRAKAQIEGVNTNADVHVRDILPSEDLDNDQGSNVNTWTNTNREWIQSGLSADTLNQVYEIDASNRADEKVIGIFALSSTAADPITTEIDFEDGTGSRFERLMFQENQTFTEGDLALLRNPIVFNEGKDAIIYQWTNDSGSDQVIYHGAVAEKAGTTLGTRSQNESAPTGVARRPQPQA